MFGIRRACSTHFEKSVSRRQDVKPTIVLDRGVISWKEHSMAPVPDGIAFLVSQDECFVPLHYFTSEGEIDFALLNFRTGENDFIPLTEAHPHVHEKGLWAQVYIDGVGLGFQQ